MSNHKYYSIMCLISYIAATTTHSFLQYMFAFLSVVYGILGLLAKDKPEQRSEK